MSSLAKKVGTASRVWREGGPRKFSSVVRLKAAMWWRRDDRLGLSGLTGEVHEHMLGAKAAGRMFDALGRPGFEQVFKQEETYVFRNSRLLAG